MHVLWVLFAWYSSPFELWTGFKRLLLCCMCCGRQSSTAIAPDTPRLTDGGGGGARQSAAGSAGASHPFTARAWQPSAARSTQQPTPQLPAAEAPPLSTGAPAASDLPNTSIQILAPQETGTVTPGGEPATAPSGSAELAILDTPGSPGSADL
jgi:hypothetical protein